MKTCKGCTHADWDKTVAGKLHPSGEGRCTYEYKRRVLPQAYYWLCETAFSGGEINRHTEFDDHCIYFERGD